MENAGDLQLFRGQHQFGQGRARPMTDVPPSPPSVLSELGLRVGELCGKLGDESIRLRGEP